MTEHKMNDNELKRKLRESLQSMSGGDVPEFAVMWANVERQHRAARKRYQRFAGTAIAVAVAVVAIMMRPPGGNDVTASYLSEEDLMSSTQWQAPSDVLLPERRFEIYTEVPELIDTNELHEESLL
jgi:hypothetical protein